MHTLPQEEKEEEEEEENIVPHKEKRNPHYLSLRNTSILLPFHQ